MAEEPGAAAGAAESLPLPGQEHREGEELGHVSPKLMDTQETHLHTRGGMSE